MRIRRYKCFWCLFLVCFFFFLLRFVCCCFLFVRFNHHPKGGRRQQPPNRGKQHHPEAEAEESTTHGWEGKQDDPREESFSHSQNFAVLSKIQIVLKSSRTDVSLQQNRGPGKEQKRSSHGVERWATSPFAPDHSQPSRKMQSADRGFSPLKELVARFRLILRPVHYTLRRHRRPDCDEECELVLYSMPTHRSHSDCVQQLGSQANCPHSVLTRRLNIVSQLPTI